MSAIKERTEPYDRVRIGFTADEIRLDEPTRAARLKWVIVVDSSLPAGRAVNAAVCVAAATTDQVPGLLGTEAIDGTGSTHPGLPWVGCSVLGATATDLAGIRTRAADAADCFLADMPVAGQTSRVYAEYLAELGAVETVDYLALSIVGPRKRVDKLIGGLRLLA